VSARLPSQSQYTQQKQVISRLTCFATSGHSAASSTFATTPCAEVLFSILRTKSTTILIFSFLSSAPSLSSTTTHSAELKSCRKVVTLSGRPAPSLSCRKTYHRATLLPECAVQRQSTRPGLSCCSLYSHTTATQQSVHCKPTRQSRIRDLEAAPWAVQNLFVFAEDEQSRAAGEGRAMPMHGREIVKFIRFSYAYFR
jgi:hypothetical protein